MVKDLTTGSPARLIIGFSLPLLAGNLFQQFYSMADTIVVGRSIGVDALAAVGSTGAISFLVLGFVIGLTGGFSVVVAQKFGAGDEQEVRRAVAMSVYLSVLLTIVLTAVSVLCTRPLLNFMQTPANIYDDAYAYIVVIFAGTGATIFYNLLSGVLPGSGGQPNAAVFPDFVLRHQCGAGSGVHPGVWYGGGGGGLCHGGGAGAFRPAVSAVYGEKVPYSPVS